VEARAVSFGSSRKVEIARLGSLSRKVVGVSASQGPDWRIRLDFDPVIGAHFNVEAGKGARPEQAAFYLSAESPHGRLSMLWICFQQSDTLTFS